MPRFEPNSDKFYTGECAGALAAAGAGARRLALPTPPRKKSGGLLAVARSPWLKYAKDY
jgi:hypothetical protein